MSRLFMSANKDRFISVLALLIAKYGDLAKVMDVLVKEKGEEK